MTPSVPATCPGPQDWCRASGNPEGQAHKAEMLQACTKAQGPQGPGWARTEVAHSWNSLVIGLET
jgi:hypothetical protein